MKKYYLLPLLCVLMPSVTACQDTAHSLVSINNYGSESGLVEVTTTQLKNLLDSKQQFVLEAYSPYCTHCKELQPKLLKYVQEKKKTIYTFNMYTLTEEEYNEQLAKVYPAIFNESYVPRLMFINDASLTYEVSSNKFSSYSALSKMLNNHFLSSNITLINTEEELKVFEAENSSYLAYCYDLETVKSLEIADQYVITNEVAKFKKPVVLINYVGYAGVFNDLCSKYGADYISFAALIEEKEVTKTIDYLTADGSELNNMISSL